MKKELTRKRNIDLNKKLDDLKFEVQYQKYLNSESYNKATSLIEELELLRLEFLQTISNLKKSQNEYDDIIHNIKIMQQTLKDKTRK